MATTKEFLKCTLPGLAKEYRRQHCISQEKMAELLHVSPRAYTDLENGKYCFSAQSLLSLISLLEEHERAILIQDFINNTEDNPA